MKTGEKETELVQHLNRLRESASQTAGPYVHIGCVPSFAGLKGMYNGVDLGRTMVNDKTAGRRVSLRGRVIDGAGSALRDALVEIWQADHFGLYNSPSETRGAPDPNFSGWGRCATDANTGEFRFETIKPGRVPRFDGRLQAPYIHFWIAARGINLGLHTRMYFPDEIESNDEDPVILGLEHRHRAKTLIASLENGDYVFNIRLQGEAETVFFDV